MVMLGYESGSKAYRLYDPVAHHVHVSRDMVFDELAQWDWESSGEAMSSSNNTFVITYSECVNHGPGKGAETSTPQPGNHVLTPVAAEPGTPGTPPTTTPIRFATLPTDASQHLDAEHNDGPLRFRTIDDIIDDSLAPGQASRELDTPELHLISAKEPSTFAEVEREPC
ncbi:hypothetical protein E2562_035531 [Oryza meyeriana var. granulata]|uniref:Retroviral polymerase SH3-like domain-containing protein n=1 Tax=Oryza meyeriana var. granulata TaxID=110450 RepID=A0A6G1E6U8_9ORYZ|nr:hypothetical protein E2562_035531 [Oryza meyeriana var. granulata]